MEPLPGVARVGAEPLAQCLRLHEHPERVALGRASSSHLSCCTHSPGLSLVKSTHSMGLAQRTRGSHRTLHRAICPPSCQRDCPSNPQPFLRSPPAVPKHLALWHALSVWLCVLHFPGAGLPWSVGFLKPLGTKLDCFGAPGLTLLLPGLLSRPCPPVAGRGNRSPRCTPAFP